MYLASCQLDARSEAAAGVLAFGCVKAVVMVTERDNIRKTSLPFSKTHSSLHQEYSTVSHPEIYEPRLPILPFLCPPPSLSRSCVCLVLPVVDPVGQVVVIPQS